MDPTDIITGPKHSINSPHTKPGKPTRIKDNMRPKKVTKSPPTKMRNPIRKLEAPQTRLTPSLR